MKLIIFKVGKILLVAFITIFCVGNFNYSARADSLTDKKNELNSIKDQMNTQTQSIAAKQQEAKSLSNQIAIIDSQINIAQLQIRETEKQIDITQNEIEGLSTQIQQKQDELAEQKKVLGDSLIILYEEANKGFVDIYLTSNNLSDILDRTEYLGSVENKIETIMTEVKKMQNELKQKKQEEEDKKVNLADLKTQQENGKNNLIAQQNGKNDLLIQTKGQEASFQSMLADYKNQAKTLQSQITAAEAVGKTKSYGGGGVKPNPAGIFNWPAPPYVTQGYGMTSFAQTGVYNGKIHNGIDLGGAGWCGNNISAVGDGRVVVTSSESESGGWGNMVMILHSNGLTSLYGHMNAIYVSEGQNVKTGQAIGVMGWTGMCFPKGPNGCHLHFSIYSSVQIYGSHNGGGYYGPAYEGTVNPLDYLK